MFSTDVMKIAWRMREKLKGSTETVNQKNSVNHRRRKSFTTAKTNDASPYQRRRILARLHVCQLKQRTDLWYRNTSFFSETTKKAL